jgi:hypothetical protein
MRGIAILAVGMGGGRSGEDGGWRIVERAALAGALLALALTLSH